MHLHLDPDSKYWMAEACSELDIRARLPFLAAANRRDIIKASGLELFMEIIRLFETDEVVIKPAFRALVHIIPEPGAVEYLLEMGGREVVDGCLNYFKDDPLIKADGTKIMYALLGKGAAVAMKDVKRVTTQFVYTVSWKGGGKGGGGGRGRSFFVCEHHGRTFISPLLNCVLISPLRFLFLLHPLLIH